MNYFYNFLNWLNEFEKDVNNFEITKGDFSYIFKLEYGDVCFLKEKLTNELFLKMLVCRNEDQLEKYFKKIDEEDYNFNFYLDLERLNLDGELEEYFDYDRFLIDMENKYVDKLIKINDDPQEILLKFENEKD